MPASPPDPSDIVIRTTTDDPGQPLTVVTGAGSEGAEALESLRRNAARVAGTYLANPAVYLHQKSRFEVIGVSLVAGVTGFTNAHSPEWTAFGTLIARRPKL